MVHQTPPTHTHTTTTTTTKFDKKLRLLHVQVQFRGGGWRGDLTSLQPIFGDFSFETTSNVCLYVLRDDIKSYDSPDLTLNNYNIFSGDDGHQLGFLFDLETR